MYPKKHIERISAFNNNFIIQYRFSGGMSNYTYKVCDISTEEEYVFRIKGENGEKFVDYNIEQKNIVALAKSGLVPSPLALFPDEGIKISSYIKGKDLNTINYQSVADVLYKLHTSNVKLTNEYQHLERLNTYEQYHHQINPLYSKTKSAWLILFKQHLKEHIAYPCHNDSQKANFIETETHDYALLDWEFAGINDYIYDLAAFGNQDFKDAITLLETYAPNPSNDLYLRLYGWRIFQCLQWFNVAHAKHYDGLSEKLNIPFAKVAQKYLESAVLLLEQSQKYLP